MLTLGLGADTLLMSTHTKGDTMTYRFDSRADDEIRDLKTIGELRRNLRRIAIEQVFVSVTYSHDDSIYMRVSKAEIAHVFRGYPAESAIVAVIRDSEPNSIYIN